MALRSRDWCFTLNNWTDEQYASVLKITAAYLCVGKEVGESGTPHLQGYLYFANAVSFESMKKKIPGAHLEKAKGTSEQASTYCKKEGDWHEQGDLPEAQGKRNDLATVREMIKEGKGMKEIVEVASNFQTVRSAEVLIKYIEQPRTWKTHVTWVWGPSGCGKTKYAVDTLPSAYLKNPSTGKWWDGYDADAEVILDEIDRETDYGRLKELTDRYTCRVETKGGTRQFLARKIVITSLYDPKVLFSDRPENGYEMLRRIDEIIKMR